MVNLEHDLNEEQLDRLLKQRSGFISISAEIAKLVEPKKFQLLLENISNVRNTIVVCGALASIGMLVLSSDSIRLPLCAEVSFGLSVAAFLASILIYSIYLQKNLNSGLSAYDAQLKESTAVARKGQEIINQRIDRKISQEELEERLLDIYKEIEFGQVRPQDKGEKKFPNDSVRFLGQIGNFTYIVAIGLMMTGLLLGILH